MIVMIWMLNLTNICHQKKKDNLRKTIKMMKWLKDTEKNTKKKKFPKKKYNSLKLKKVL